jgi:4-amino-4-deoxy-L-arabinose transferase-like glycosyltransferase
MPSSAFRPSPMASDSLWTGPRVLVAVFLLVVAVVITRLVMVFYWDVPLAIDEAQYLVWARELQAGYFSKPPFIAWTIAASTGLCGSESAGCARLFQPLALALAGLGLATTAWLLWRSFAASIWAFALFVSMPLVGFYSQLATTDAWLLLWWAWALCAFVWALSGGGNSRSRLGNPNVTQGSNELAWIVLGVICGLGLLTKYSMAVFSVSVAIVLLREGLVLRAGPWLTLLVAMAVMSPNLFWNSEWGFPTLGHTLSYAGGKGEESLNLAASSNFLLSQFLVMSPLVMLAFLWLSLKSLFTWGQNAALSRGPGGSPWALDAGARLGLVFAWPMLLVVSFQGLSGKVEANWAAPASVGITLAVVGLWCAASNQIFRSRFLGRSIRGIGLPLTLVLNLSFTAAVLAMPWGLEQLGRAGVAGKDPRVPFVTLEQMAADVETWVSNHKQAVVVTARDRHLLAYLDKRLGLAPSKASTNDRPSTVAASKTAIKQTAVKYWDPFALKEDPANAVAGVAAGEGSPVRITAPKAVTDHHWALQKRLDLSAMKEDAPDVILYVSKALTPEQSEALLSNLKRQGFVKTVKLEPLGDVDHGFVLIAIERVR